MPLFKHPALFRLWLADVLSKAGSEITGVALPLTAVLVLNATPAQMGLLGIARSTPNLLFGLFAGVWVDRTQRRALLILADLGRGLLLLLIPLAAWLGTLHIALLYVILCLTGTFDLLFGAAYHAYLPALVPRPQLVDANSKLEISRFEGLNK